MAKKSPSLANVLAALPSVQAEIRADIAARIAAGENIVSSEAPEIAEAIEARRAELNAGRTPGRKADARKSAA